VVQEAAILGQARVIERREGADERVGGDDPADDV